MKKMLLNQQRFSELIPVWVLIHCRQEDDALACAGDYFLPHCRMLYTNTFRVTVDATNQFDAQRKALKRIKADPTSYLSGTYVGVGKKQTSFLNMLLFGK